MTAKHSNSAAAEIIDIPEDARPVRQAPKASAAAPRRRRKRPEDGASKARREAPAARKVPAAGEAVPKARREASTPRKKPGPNPSAAENARGRAPRAAKSAQGERPKGRAAAHRDPSRKPISQGNHRKQTDSGMQTRVKRPESPAKRRGRLAEIHGDMFLEAWDAPAPKRRKGGHGSRDGGSRTAVAVNLLLLTCIAAMAALGGLLVYRHNVYLEMKQVVEAQTFYEGTTVDGMDVSDMTLVSALDYWQNRVEPAYADRSVQVGEAGTVTARDLGYRSDYEEVLSNAWSAGRHGSLEQRYHSAVQRVAHPVAYSVDRAVYSTQLLDAYVRAMAAKIDTPAVDAGIASFDTSSYSFVFTESQTGRRLDAEGLKRQMAQVLDAGSGSVEVSVETVQPAVTTEEVSSRYGMIASAVTNASSSSSNRLKNIQRAMSYINGVCLKPGETFSFNKVVGRRTTDRGFRMATAYSGGSVTEEIGGGICQVSTTLFNCAVKSDLEIVERHNHSLTVGYVDKGKDATVNWDSQDLKFKNTTGGDVYICCLMTSDKRVRFAIFGKMLENGETITVEAVTTKTIKYDTQYEVNPLLPPGQSRVVEPGKNGYKAEAYKVRWDAAGNQISKELLCKSFYKAKDQIIQVGQ